MALRRRSACAVTAGLTLGVSLASLPLVLGGATRAPARAGVPATRPAVPALPLAFQANHGQTSAQVRYLAHGPGYTLFLTRDEAVLGIARGRRGGDVLRMRLAGATRSQPRAEHRLPGLVNVMRGAQHQWRSGISTYARIRYRSVYPGVDAVYHGTQNRLEYDFQLSPGAEPGRIGLDLSGARSTAVASNGDLLIKLPGGTLRQLRPIAYQQIGGRRLAVPVAYTVDGSRVGFHLGRYDHTRRLIIDPIITPDYSTYIGGRDSDSAAAVAVDSSGNVYVTGSTLSDDFPRVAGRVATWQGEHDSFVTKLNPDRTTMVYSDLIGGCWEDYGYGIAVDGSGNAYVTGETDSDSTQCPSVPFPTTQGAFQTTEAGAEDAFVYEVNATGSFVYSTLLGGAKTSGVIGSGVDYGQAIAADADGNAYVTGNTTSASFPGVTNTSLQPSLSGGGDAFVTKVNAGGASLGFSTYLGGSGAETGYGIALDSSRNVYVDGYTTSSSFPGVTGTSAQTTLDNGHPQSSGSGMDGFVTKLASTGKTISYSTYIGGEYSDFAQGIAVDPSGQASVIGTTNSLNFFPLVNALYKYGLGTSDAFLAKVKADGTGFVYSTYLGGSTGDAQGVGAEAAGCEDHGAGVAVDSSGSTYVTGWTCSDPFLEQTGQPSNWNAYVAKFNPTGSALSWATYLGGNASDYGHAIAVDPNGNAWVVGNTASYTTTNSFPISANAVQPTYAGGPSPDNGGTGDAFVSEFRSHPAQIDSGPSGAVGTGAVSFGFSSPSPSDTFKCQIDAGTAAACTSGKSYSLAEGAHTFSVQAIDAGSAPDGPAATRRFTVDTTPPSTPGLTSPDDGAVTAVQPSFAWTPATDTSPLSYQLLVDGQKLQDVAGSACSASCVATAPAPLAGGSHSWKVVAVDAAGNTSASAARSFTVSSPPTPSFTIAPNPALAGRPVTFDASGSRAGASAIADYAWDLDGNGSFETDTGAVATATRSYSAAGTVHVALRVTSADGESATTAQDLRVTDPTAVGTQVGVSIDKGAQYTNHPEVTLTIVAPPSATALLISNDGGFAAALPQAVAKEVPWTLDSSGPERLPKTVYLRFLAGTFASSNYTDDIILDERPPVVDAASVVGGGAGASRAAAAAAKLRTWKVRVKAHDTNSGVGGVQVAMSKKKAGKLLKYAAKVTVKLGSRPRFIRAKDRAGNFSPWKKLR